MKQILVPYGFLTQAVRAHAPEFMLDEGMNTCYFVLLIMHIIKITIAYLLKYLNIYYLNVLHIFLMYETSLIAMVFIFMIVTKYYWYYLPYTVRPIYSNNFILKLNIFNFML